MVQAITAIESASTRRNSAPTAFKPWGLLALAVSFGANLFLGRICLTYCYFLGRGALLSSYVDSRAGLWELKGIVPFLIGVAIVCAFAAAKFKILKRLAIYSSVAAIFLGFLCFMLGHLIRTALH